LKILPRNAGMHVLDLGGVSETNVTFLSELGCKVYLDNLLANFDRAKPGLENRRFTPDAAAAFVEDNLHYRAEQFDAILVWDVLEFLDRELLTAIVPRLFDILKPGGGMLAFFHTQTRGEGVELYRYQIEGVDTLLLRSLQNRPLPATFNNRSIERLFSEFDSLKFFLTRDHLREVIVIR
jgi:cyclopropane fatty-acyl-phospholipid synthase-like methyltransferase